LRFLALSDLHGNTTALKSVLEEACDTGFDYILIGGDLTDLEYHFEDGEDIVKRAGRVFEMLEQYDTPYFFVWGNWDLTLSFLRRMRYRRDEKWTIHKHPESVEMVMSRGDRGIVHTMPLPLYNYSLEVAEILESLKLARPLDIVDTVELGVFKLTSRPELADERTILLTHFYNKLTKAYVHLDAHVHFGRVFNNYVNLGFVYRWRERGGESGCYWLISFPESPGEPPMIEWINHGGMMKELRCGRGVHRGVFYTPNYWRICPACHDKRNSVEGLDPDAEIDLGNIMMRMMLR